MPVAVPLIAAGVGAAGSVLASRSQSRAAQQTANASQQATDAAIAEQRRQYDLARADQQPWLQTGSGALAQLARLYGISAPSAANPQIAQPTRAAQTYGLTADLPQTQPLSVNMVSDVYGEDGGGTPVTYTGGVSGGGTGTVTTPSVPTTPTTPGSPVTQPAPAGGQYDTFWQSPDYQYRLNESMRALTARNAALGIQDSGAAQRSALNLAGNLASGEFNNYANRLSALAGVGQTAAQSTANIGQNYANSYGNLLAGNAANLGSSYQQQGAANSNLWSTLAGIGTGVVNNYPWGR